MYLCSRERKAKKVICTVALLCLFLSLGTVGTAWAYSYNQSSKWSDNLLTNPDPSGESGWSKASSGSTGKMSYTNSEFQNEDDGDIGTWYQDVSLSAADVVRAKNGELQAYASANIWGAVTSRHYGAVTLLFYNSSGQVYNGDSKTWGSAPGLSNHNTMYGASGTTKYSVTIGGTDGKYYTGKKWHAMYLGSGDNLSGYSYSADETSKAHTNGITVPAGTVKIRYCVSHHCNINWSAAKKFCLKLKDAVAPSIVTYLADASDGKGIAETHKAGTVITYTIRFSEKVTVNSGGTLTTNLGQATYIGSKTENELTSVTYTFTIPNNGTISDSAVVGLVSLNGLKVTDDAGNAKTFSLSEANFNSNTSFGTTGVIRMDNRPPELVSFTSEGISKGTFLKEGDTLVINANFHENVKVSGTPVIILSNGKCMYGTQKSSTDSRVVEFSYTIEAGDDVNQLKIQSCDLSGIVDKVEQKSTDSLSYAQFCEENKSYMNPYELSIDTTKPQVEFIPVEEGCLNAASVVSVKISDDIAEGVMGSGVSEVWSVWTQNTGTVQPEFPTASNVQTSETGVYAVGKPQAEGIWYLWIKAKDAVGNVDIAKGEEAYIFDLSAPEIVITNELYENTNVTKTVSVTVTDTNSGFLKAAYVWEDEDGSLVGNGICEASDTILLPEEHGSYTLTVTAEDMAGNAAKKEVCGILVDKTAPVIAISGEQGVYMKENALTVVTADADTGIAVNLYAWTTSPVLNEAEMVWQVLTSDSVLTPEGASGIWYLHIKSEDFAGNVAYAVSSTCFLDCMPPEIHISPNGNAGIEGEPEYAIVVFYSDNISLEEELKAEYALSDGIQTGQLEYQAFTQAEVLSVPAREQDVYVHIRVTDKVGNVAYFCSEVFAADVSAPAGSIKVVSSIFTNKNTVTLELTAEDDCVKTEGLMMNLMIDGVETGWEDFTGEKTVEFEETEGEHRFSIKFKDRCDNVSEVFHAEEVVVYDVTKPEITLVYSTENPTSQDVTVTASLSEEEDFFQGDSSYTFVDNGTFLFQAVDKAGNVCSKQAKVTWIDKTAPVITLSSANADQKPHRMAEIEIMGTDAANEVEKMYYRYTKQGEAALDWQAVTGEKILLEKLEGYYLFEAYGVDTVGNESQAVSLSFWFDNTIPTAEISYSPAKRTAQNVTAVIVFNEENVTVTNTQNNEKEFLFTENGTFTFEYLDAAGNKGKATAEVSWIDRSLPKASTLVKDMAGSVVDEEQWTNEDLKVTILAQRNAYVKSVTFNGAAVEEAEGIQKDEEFIDTYIISCYGTLQYVLKDVETEVESEGSLEVKIDKEAPVCGEEQIRYSETGWTNKDVVVIAAATDRLSEVSYYVQYVGEGGVITEEAAATANTYVFTENGVHTFIFKDEAGNRSEKTVEVSNIDKEAPIAHISYQTEDGNFYQTSEWTNQDVTASISFEDVSDVSVKSNNGSDSYTFRANGSMVFTYADAAGNEGSTEAKVEKIDKIAPTGYVTMDTYTWTNQNVVATLHAADEASGTSDMKYTFVENGTYTFVLKDNAGNQTEISCTQDRIDKEAPELDIYYSQTEKTPFAVYAKASANESVQWGSDISYKFEANGSYTFSAMDRAGNRISKEAKVDWIDREIPEVELVYSTTDMTSQDVFVELRAKNEEETIVILNNDQLNYYRFKENGEFTFEYANASRTETAAITAQVTWIDKKAPEFVVSYSTQEVTKEDVVVTISADKEVKWPNGFVMNEDGSASYTFHENQKVSFMAGDALGNKETIVIEITNIDKEAPVIIVQDSFEAVPLGEVFDAAKGVTVSDEHTTENMLSIDSSVDIQQTGVYTVCYKAEDSVGNQSEARKTVVVYNPDAFQVILNGQLAYGQEIVLTESKMHLTTIHKEGNAVLKILPGKADLGKFKTDGTEIQSDYVFAENGYYTLFVRDDERNGKLITVYVTE